MNALVRCFNARRLPPASQSSLSRKDFNPVSPISLVGASRRRALLAGACALAASAGLTAVSAQDAQAAFTLAACGGSNAAKNQGATFQNTAQTYWRGVFATSNGCGGAVSVQPYVSNGSGNGLAAMGAGGGSTASPFINCSPNCGVAQPSSGGRTLPAGERDLSTSFASTDEPPTPTQQAAMNAGLATAADDALVHVIPVATGSATIVLHAPEGCNLQTIVNRTGGAGGSYPDGNGDRLATGDTSTDKTSRPRINNTLLEKAFAGASDADTWGELTPGISGTATGTQNAGLACTAVPVKRIVRQDNSGTTYAFKAFLNLINPSRGWLTTYAASPNTVWPASGGTGTANPAPRGSGGPTGTPIFCENSAPNLLCSSVGSGGGNTSGLTRAVLDTDGAIGYVDLSTARGSGFEITPSTSAQDYRFWVPVQNNPGGTPTGFVEPTFDAIAHKPNVGARGANCGDVTVRNAPTPAASPKNDPTLGDWSTAYAAGGAGYSNCVLTYALAWDDSAPAYTNNPTFNAAEEQAKARTVKDFLTTVVGTAGQQFANVDFSPVPNGLSQPILTYAQNGVAAIDWAKTASTPPSTTPPSTTPPVTTPPSNTPGNTPPVVVPPSNAFTVGSGKVNAARTSLAFTVKLPGKGALTAAATYKSGSKTVKITSAKATITAAGTVKLTVKLSSAARKELAKKKKLTVSVKFTFTPTGGTAKTSSKTTTFRAAKKKTKK